MQLTSREAATIAYALTMLALTKDEGINATVTELRDLATRVMVASKENKAAAPDYGYGTFPAH